MIGRVLVVDDEPIVRDILKHSLEIEGFVADAACDLTSMEQNLRQRTYDAVLLDLFLEHEDGLEALPILTRDFPRVKVFIMSAQGTIELAVSAMESGASAFIAKSKDPKAIVDKLKERLFFPAKDRDVDSAAGNLGMIGEGEAMRAVCARIIRVKDVDSTVLITGESGTGKEMVARAIHAASNRRDRRFEAVNCGAIPGPLLESELFGHKRGAFTDAKSDRKGIFEVCTGGTLLLDEIGEMPLELQVKLLRVLQERTVTPLGSCQSLPVDVRVLAATNVDLIEAVRKGQFREDLYFRLAVLSIRVPALREHREDIPDLVRHFVSTLGARFGRQMAPVSPEILMRLKAYDWPGNVRELQNAVERGIVLSRDNHLHYEDMMPDTGYQQRAGATLADDGVMNLPLSEAKQNFERQYLKQLLEATRGNISEISRISGRYRADVYRLLTKHGVEWEDFRPTIALPVQRH